MNGSNRWGRSRYAALVIVVAAHVALFAVLLRSPGIRAVPPPVDAVQLIDLPPVSRPTVRAESAPQRLRTGTVIAFGPPSLAAVVPAGTPAVAPSSEGGGAGVDWAAEARRALHAFEIRSAQPTKNQSVSGQPGDDVWLRQARHHAGEQFRTPAGDWIVWINETCYQVAGSGPSAVLSGATPPPIICPVR